MDQRILGMLQKKAVRRTVEDDPEAWANIARHYECDTEAAHIGGIEDGETKLAREVLRMMGEPQPPILPVEQD